MYTNKFMSTAATAFRNGEVLAQFGFSADDIRAYRETYIAVYDFGQHIDFENMDEDDVRVMALDDATVDLSMLNVEFA